MKLSPALLALVAGTALTVTAVAGPTPAPETAPVELEAKPAPKVAVPAPALATPAVLNALAAVVVPREVVETVEVVELPVEPLHAFSNDPCPPCGRG